MPEEKKQNYPGNSHKSRVTVEKKVTVDAEVPEGDKARPTRGKVIEGTVVKKEKSLGQKIAATFSGDDAKGLGEYLLLDVAIPAIKALIVEATEQGIQRLMFGDVRPRSTGARTSSYTSYNRMSGNSSSSSMRRRDEPRTMSRSSRATFNFDDIILENLRDSEEVIENLRNILDEYGVVTVADLYDLVNITSEWTDVKWGWDNLSGLQARRIREGYLVDLPKPSYLE